MLNDPEKRMVKARANLVMAAPFFGSLALRLRLKEADKEAKDDFTTDGIHIFYKPEAVKNYSIEDLTGQMAHLVMHPAFMHHTRRSNRDNKKWNRACDYAINDIVKSAGMHLKHGTFHDPQYSGMSAEAIYAKLEEEEGKDPPDGPGGGDDVGGDGGVQDSPSTPQQGGSQSQVNEEEREWKTAVIQAAHVAKQAGKLPSAIDRMIEELTAPVYPWKDVLRRFATERAQDDYSWKKGNRRFLYQDLYLPTRESERAGVMVVTIDVSGSVTDKELAEFGAEVKAIHTDIKPSDLYVIYCSAAIHHVDHYKPEDDVVIEPHGTGGTDFVPPFEYLEEHQIAPQCFIYLTDGYGRFPEEEQAPFPVLWCINNEQVIPPFGEHLILQI